MVYWASVGLMVGIAVCGILPILLSLAEDEDVGFVNAMLIVLLVSFSIALGVRIGEGVF